jgi:TetR/AcrR family transcriptional repressor of nem operon
MNRLSPHREEILSQVHTLIAAGGYTGLKKAALAAPAAGRKRRPRRDYPDKQALLRAFVAYQRELTDAWIGDVQAATSDPSSQLRRYIDEWSKSIEAIRAPFCICALLAVELPILPEEAAKDVRDYFHYLGAWVASVMARGEGQGSIRLAFPPETEAKIFMAAVQGAMLSARAYGDPSVFERIAAAQLARFGAISTPDESALMLVRER